MPVYASGMDPAPLLEPAIGYVRVSTEREEMISPENQRAAIERQAAANGCYIPEGNWPAGRWIEEPDVSGADSAAEGSSRRSSW